MQICCYYRPRKLLEYDSIAALEQKYDSLENAYLQLTGVPSE